jgi:hypothetical protein
MFASTRKIGGTANDYDVALSIWETIVNPISEANISGEDPIGTNGEDVGNQQVSKYYREDRGNEQRHLSLTHPMRTFHNHWVKNVSLIGKFKGNSKSLIDLACGEAGDLHKWIDAGFTSVLGLDLSEKNITNSDSGALSRLRKEMFKKDNKRGVDLNKYVFMPMDTSKEITKDSIGKIEDDNNKYLANVLWGFEAPLNNKLKKVYGLAANKFDVASCQFALHYFFKNEKTLSGFVKNVANHVKLGGYFIGTCFDGNLVDEMFEEKGTKMNEMVVGKKDEKPIWAIQKLYDGAFKTNKTLGTKISVFVESINQLTDRYEEYLVDYEKLQSELAKHGLRELSSGECTKLRLDTERSTGHFDDLFSSMKKHYKGSKKDFDKDKENWIHKALNMDDAEKEYSFLNRWFIFVKDVPGKIAKKKSHLKAKQVVEEEDKDEDDDKTSSPEPPPKKVSKNKDKKKATPTPEVESESADDNEDEDEDEDADEDKDEDADDDADDDAEEDADDKDAEDEDAEDDAEEDADEDAEEDDEEEEDSVIVSPSPSPIQVVKNKKLAKKEAVVTPDSPKPAKEKVKPTKKPPSGAKTTIIDSPPPPKEKAAKTTKKVAVAKVLSSPEEVDDTPPKKVTKITKSKKIIVSPPKPDENSSPPTIKKIIRKK